MEPRVTINPRGQIRITGQSGTSKLHLVAYTDLYRYSWVSVLPGNLLRSRRHWYNLLYVDFSLPQSRQAPVVM